MGLTRQIIRGVRDSSKNLEKSSARNSKRGGKKRRENYRRGRRR